MFYSFIYANAFKNIHKNYYLYSNAILLYPQLKNIGYLKFIPPPFIEEVFFIWSLCFDKVKYLIY